MITTGTKGKKSVLVVPENTAEAVGSGLLPVFSTPALIALMEGCCAESVAGSLPEGDCTVGISLDVKHTSATPVSLTVTAESELVAVDGRRLTFKVTAYDDAGEVGHGTHERFIVTADRFMNKANAKLS
ncbi:MAG: thioesterase family protein [Clostridia bacterium]|nr:thioesterase family protein [Clostridia bacterium]